jgi:hypothetical protein
VPVLPSARGELTDLLLGRLIVPAHPIGTVDWSPPDDALGDEDFQLALYLLYELHYRGFDEVDDRWEWEPSLLALRAELEGVFEAAVRDVVGHELPGPAPEDTDRALRAVIDEDTGPSLSIHLARHGTKEQMLEFLVHRSAYQLKEADPHSWALPRLSGPPKAALVEVQADEYGGGRPERIHAEMFADTLRAAGLDPAYGAYLDQIPGLTLATVNLMSLMGLHRRLRAGIVGHLAAFEMTSACRPAATRTPCAGSALATMPQPSSTSTWRRTLSTRTSPPWIWQGASSARTRPRALSSCSELVPCSRWKGDGARP